MGEIVRMGRKDLKDESITVEGFLIELCLLKVKCVFDRETVGWKEEQWKKKLLKKPSEFTKEFSVEMVDFVVNSLWIV